MTDVRISDMPAATAANDGMLAEVSDGGTTRSLSIGNLKAWFNATFPTFAQVNAGLAQCAALAGATFSGLIKGVAPAADDSSNAIPTTSWFMGQLASAVPVVDGTAASGSAIRAARADHVHPTDTSRASTAALAAGLATVAQQSDLNVAQQNLLYQGLLIAALRGVPTGIVDGILDPFSSTADINTGSSSGYTFSSSAGTIGATVAPGTTLSTSANAISDSDASASYVKGNAFDGSSTTSWASGLKSPAAVGAAYIGQDFGSGVSKVVSTVVFTSSYEAADLFSSGLFQYADSPSGPWTTAVTLSLPSTATTTQTYTIPSVGAHRCWRLLCNAATSSGNAPEVTELTMQAPGVISTMTLQSATLASAVTSPSAARVLIQVDSTSAAIVPNTDLLAYFSRDGGATFTRGTLSLVQSMPDGTAVYDTGFFDVSGQPAGNSTMTYRATTPTAKAVVLTGASMQVRP